MQPGGADIQKKQATNLLTVLANKPEARKIIRASMEVQFCNPHSKILYVAHIIRQVLRLDIDTHYSVKQMPFPGEFEELVDEEGNVMLPPELAAMGLPPDFEAGGM